jgi:Ca2+:H+ antiporter
MNPLFLEIRRTPLLRLLVFVPIVLVMSNLRPESPMLQFVLSVLAIVPLAALLSHATESVAAKTVDTFGGMLNAMLGNPTKLIIALAALAGSDRHSTRFAAGHRATEDVAVSSRLHLSG